MNISITKTAAPKQKPDQSHLGFGIHFTDHMFIMDYTEGKGWHDARIVPYGPMAVDPSAMALHYGQAIFEGLKAYRTANGEILLFRPEKNMQRVNNSNRLLCIPEINVDDCVQAIKELVKVDAYWIPSAPGTSLYIRPFIFASEPALGVRPAHSYQFVIILSPVGAYYKEGINPVKIYVESNYVRAVRGGLGEAKTVANYAASLKAQVEAKEQGYTQVLWLDGVEKKYVEEVGTMNVFFKINGEVVTPALTGTILPGITRMSTIELLKKAGVPVSERKITIQEIYDAHAAGKLEEAFGTGTAAVISPIGEFSWNGNVIKVNDGKIGEVSQRVYDTITGIQSGELEDTFGWIQKL
ncbi:branched-chain amino acid aminotransferase [Ruminiclostridium sufflavum DSM 19573]|uniref:Branched-chain-amino-acid aminotransferase n=1 Tax=Ruminiclostridium sufflavum DSM 19573 TaxID=1121337 RepID=A0A318XMH6_9FIRM|nr:branched-chain amino acid aminotransferase [Ruminiclostridium sufflavum]PYG86849.1 branched-chain amino acid aminotransferase [Ruminiclostridium sufflavum DSM 19573]